MSGIPDQNSFLPNVASISVIVGIDTSEVTARRKRTKRSLFGGDTTGTSIFDAGYGEICLRKKRRGNGGGQWNGAAPSNYVPVITALNGAGDETQTRASFLESVQYCGVVATQGKLRRDGSYAPDVFPALQHGTATVTNNGRMFINSGDYVMYDVPLNAEDARTHMTKVSGMPDGRILPFFRPYNPVTDSFSPERMDVLRGLYNDPSQSGASVDPGVSVYGGLMTQIKNVMALGYLAGSYMNIAAIPSMQDFVRLRDSDLVDAFSMFGTVRTATRNDKGANFLKDLCNSLLAFRASDIHFTQPTTGNAHIKNMMKNTTMHLAQHFKRLDWEIKARVIGQALSSAGTGQNFDIFLNQPPV